MKKIYIFLCVIMSLFCSSCSIFKGQYIDIAELYYQNYNTRIIKELNLNCWDQNDPKMVISVELLTKEGFESINSYDEMRKRLGVDFVNLIVIKQARNSFEKEYYSLVAIECKSEKDIIKYVENGTPGFYNDYVTENNICYLDISGIHMLFGNCVEEGSLLYNNNKEILLSGYYLGYRFQVPENVVEINQVACVYNHELTELICNDSLVSIGVYAFRSAISLRYIEFNNKLEEIQTGSFYDCPIEYVVIPKSVKYIGMGAFSNGNIFCEVSSKPDEWDKDFAVQNAKVYWAGEWEYNEDGIPVAIDN